MHTLSKQCTMLHASVLTIAALEKVGDENIEHENND